MTQNRTGRNAEWQNVNTSTPPLAYTQTMLQARFVVGKQIIHALDLYTEGKKKKQKALF